MRVLARKGWRDLWQLKGQAIAVALIAAVGIANLVMSRATLGSLEASRERYYREYAFADIFADIKRAPEQVARQLRDISGVAAVDTRIIASGRAEIEGFDHPIRIQAMSLPGLETRRLNRLHLRAGRLPEFGERDALVVSDAFAEAHMLRPGDTLALVLYGRRESFHIVGVGATPEFVAQLGPGTVFPDPLRFAIVWISRPAMETAVDLEGAFNSVAVALRPGTRPEPVIAAIDRLLARYGGTGAIERRDQPSYRYLEEEFRQLRSMAWLFPTVFLGVAAFVLYVVLGRLIGAQREQIGMLKAFGYSSFEVWRHYASLALVIGGLGSALGIALGVRLGSLLADLYRQFYRLPFLDFALSPGIVWLAATVGLGSALLGAAVPVWHAARLPPAEAMRPGMPQSAPLRIAARLPGQNRLSQAHRLIARNLSRRPLRTLLTWVGLALGTAVMMMGRFQNDAVDHTIHGQFELAERHDLSATFIEPLGPSVLHELAALPGVRAAEAQRAVPVRVRFRAAEHRTVLLGLTPDARLRRTLDDRGHPIRPPLRGVLVTDYLAGMLGARPGDMIELETLQGRRRVLRLPLAGVVSEPFGVQAYMPLSSLDAAMGEGERVTHVVMSVDGRELARLFDALDRRPRVALTQQRREDIRNFYNSMAKTILTFTLISTLFGVVITFGVVYSSARVALSERARDLASLRVLGFTEGEVGYLLLGELVLLTLLAIPLGYAFGHVLIAAMVRAFDSDLFRIPHHVSPTTYAMAGVTTLVAALLSSSLVWRRVRHLDLIGVLKARD